MSKDKTTVLHLIKVAFNKEVGKPNNLRLPRDIEFVISGNNVEMKLLADAAETNMQEDKAAFEGWALALKRYAKFDKVVLSWQRKRFPKTDNRYGHYQRFLFRVDNFSWDFKSWFSVKPNCRPYLKNLEIDDASIYYLNHPSKDRGIIMPLGKEGILEFEYSFGKWSKYLKDEIQAAFLDRQLPVGVFRKKVSKDNSIFTRGKSAIDIWGISKNNDLLLFELKADGNNKMGIITELYFYCCVIQRAQKGQFRYEKNNVGHTDKIANTKKIKAYFFAPELHPLIDKKLVGLLKAPLAPKLDFHYLMFPKRGGSPITFKF